MNNSIKLPSPCELISLTPLNPLISKCQIKVCYVGEEANRNRSVITKDVATELANSLPGSPIVGFYNEETEDFEGHNRELVVKDGQITFQDTTRPYGFVDLSAKAWFQKFMDNGVEHEYLMTEGWLWTGQYPECKRIIEKGNNQSMELDPIKIDAHWTKDANGKPQFFIINEAIISKLCILGEDVEPCFEGSQITKVQFSLEDSFKEQLFSMMSEIKNVLEGGAPKMFTTYAVEIGDSLWSALWRYLEKTYPSEECYCSKYSIEGIYEEDAQKFAILRDLAELKYYRLNFSITEAEGFSVLGDLVEVTKEFTPAETAQFDSAAVETYSQEYVAARKAEDEKDEEICPNCGKLISECECKHGPEYNLEEIPEYIELTNNYSALESQYNELKAWFETLNTTYEALNAQCEELISFKKGIEKDKKQAMVNSFYMLSDDDKKEVVDNIDAYSLEDIEAKLSILCVRNKVSFDLDKNTNMTVRIDDNFGGANDNTPDWVKALQSRCE